MAYLVLWSALLIHANNFEGKPNILMIAVDDLRPQFGTSFGHPEVLAPNIDKFFPTAFQRGSVRVRVHINAVGIHDLGQGWY